MVKLAIEEGWLISCLCRRSALDRHRRSFVLALVCFEAWAEVAPEWARIAVVAAFSTGRS